MTRQSDKPYLPSTSRRTTLKFGAAGTALSALPLLPACSSSSSGSDAAEATNESVTTNETVSAAALMIGVTIAQSGAYADEGLDQQRGVELAIKHLNGFGDGGMLNTMQPSSLQGNGVLGRPVEYIIADTETRTSVAEAIATKLIVEDNVSMLIGGSSSGAAIATQTVAQDLGAIYMTGIAHSNDVTGVDYKANGFRHWLNSNISSLALAKTMVKELGAARSAYYLTADYAWGDSTGANIQKATELLGWQTIASVPTPVGTQNYTSFLTDFIASGADVLILVHYGLDMVNSVSQARLLGIPDKQVNSNTVAMAIPVYSTLMAEAAGGENCANVYGTINWHWSLQDNASVAFTSSYEAEYGLKPSEAAHTVYVQTLQYADAAQRAGSLLPCDIIRQLEGHSFDGTGNGACVYREDDHQCFKDTLVVAGRIAPASRSDILEVRDTIAAADVTYPAESSNELTSASACNNG